MDKIKKQALEAAGWKFGDAEDFLNEGRTMNIDEAIEIATSTAITLTKLEMAEVAEVLAAEVERLRAELAAAKAASVCPVELVALNDADWQCSVGVKTGADADRLYNWLRERMKDTTPPTT